MAKLFRKNLDELFEVGNQLSSCGTLSAVYELALTLVVQKVRPQSVSVFMLAKRGSLRRELIKGTDKHGNAIPTDWYKDETMDAGDSFTGKVLTPKNGSRFGTTNWSNHLSSEDIDPVNYAKYTDLLGNLSCAIAAPLNGTNQTFGVIEVINKLGTDGRPTTHDFFTAADSMWVSVISILTAKAITALRRQENLDILAGIAKELVEPFTASFDLSQTSITSTYRKMIRGLVSPLKPFNVCLLRIKGDEGLKLVATADDGIDLEDRVDLPIADRERIVRQVVDTHSEVIIPDIANDINRFQNKKWIERNNLQSFACFPLLVHDEVYGTLSVYTAFKHTFSKSDMYLLNNVAILLAAFTESIRTLEENEKLNEQLREGQERRVNAAREVGLMSVESALHKHKIKLGRYLDDIKDIETANAYKKISLTSDLEKRLTEDISEINTNLQKITKRASNESVDINEVLREELQFFGLQQKRTPHPIRLHSKFSHLPLLRIDKQEIHEIVSNLLSNAIKSIRLSKRPDGEIQITTDIVDEDDNYFVTISVIDNGVGIPTDAKDYIFNRGYTTNPLGSGYGLFFVKNIVDSYGGSVDVFSTGGSGATFTVKIPKTIYEI